MTVVYEGRVVRGAVLTYSDDPAVAGPEPAVRFWRRGAVAVAGDGRIEWCGRAARLPQRFHSLAADDYGEALVLPGFIDAHIHFPQYRMLAAPGKDLLDWLNRFTFAEERRYASVPHPRAAAEAFLDRLVQHGTTATVVFSTVHRSATETLFAAAERRGLAIISGKTMMDRNAPHVSCDDPASGLRRARQRCIVHRGAQGVGRCVCRMNVDATTGIGGGMELHGDANRRRDAARSHEPAGMRTASVIEVRAGGWRSVLASSRRRIARLGEGGERS